MVQISIWMPRIPFKLLQCAFECIESLSNVSNLVSTASHTFECFESFSNASNLFRMVRICFEFFESLSSGSNLVLKASNPFGIVLIWFRNLRIHFEWFEFPFECFESLLNRPNLVSNPSLLSGSTLVSKSSNPFRMAWISNRMLRIPCEWFEFGFKSFESHSNC